MDTFLIPEAGGDDSISAIRMLQVCCPTARIVLLDAAQVHPACGLCSAQTVQVPHLSLGLSLAVEALVSVLDRLAVHGAYLVPTGELMPELFYTDAVRASFDRWSVRRFLATKDGWVTSRNKWLLFRLLGSCVSVAETRSAWSPEHRFAKPIYGSGSRDCRVIHTLEESQALGGKGFVFQRELPGPDYCVDCVRGLGLTRRIDRQRGGADTIVEFIQDDELVGIARRVADWFGGPVANVQFRRDKNGKPWVIDAAPRFSGASGCALRAGVNWMECLLGRPGWMWAPKYETVVVRRWEESVWTS